MGELDLKQETKDKQMAFDLEMLGFDSTIPAKKTVGTMGCNSIVNCGSQVVDYSLSAVAR